MPEDYYAVLGVPQNATARQLRARFLELARDRHPDRFQGSDKEKAESEFQAITQAFNILSDPERRRQVDLELARPAPGRSRDAGQAARVYLQRGIKAYREKNYLQAAENFDRATGEDPSDARAWYYLARACRHRRRWLARARQAAEKACELEPMNVPYLKLAGTICAEAGMAVRARKFLNDALTWGGEDAEIRSALEELEKGAGGRGGLFGRG